jgi:hypothetical protein
MTRFWIPLAAVVGYHVQDIWDFFRVWKNYRPGYPGTIAEAIFSPGWLFFSPSLFIGLFNAAVYAVVISLVLRGIKGWRHRKK